MNDLDREYYVALSGVDGVGRSALKKINSRRTELQLEWSEVWTQSEYWEQLGFSPKQELAFSQFQKKYTPASFGEMLAAKEIKVILWGDDQYPSQLLNLAEAPEILFVRGPVSWDKKPQVAVVGSRQMSPYGEFVTRQIVGQLIESRLGIVSGCMYGVDMTAQQTAINAGGASIGVLAYGFDHLYPRQYKKWFENFLENGNTLVTEYAPATIPRPGNFLLRNRIVAGLSLATLVTEAALESGSMITARYAFEYQRSVAAVPGLVTSPLSQGTNWLIQHGARLVTNGKEMLELLGIELGLESSLVQEQSTSSVLPEKSYIIYQQLMRQPLSTDELQEKVKMVFPELLTHLSFLELQGMIKQHNHSWMTIKT